MTPKQKQLKVIKMTDEESNLWHIGIYGDRVVFVSCSGEPVVYKLSLTPKDNEKQD